MLRRLYDRTDDQLERELAYYRQQLAATRCKDRRQRHERAVTAIQAEISRRASAKPEARP